MDRLLRASAHSPKIPPQHRAGSGGDGLTAAVGGGGPPGPFGQVRGDGGGGGGGSAPPSPPWPEGQRIPIVVASSGDGGFFGSEEGLSPGMLSGGNFRWYSEVPP